MKHTIYKPTGEKQESNEKLSLGEMQKIVGGYVEQVYVLHNGKRCTMFVNEEGAIAVKGRDPLPMNRAATEIYHTYVLSQGKLRQHQIVDLPRIYGVAIVYDGEYRD